MKFALWKSPANPDSVRAYINDIPDFPKSAKAFVQPAGAGIKIVVSPANLTVTVENALLKFGVVDDLKNLRDLPFSSIEKLALKDRKPYSRPNEPKVTLGSDRLDEADCLDLSTIKVPEPVSIKIDHREPDSLFAEFAGLENVVVERVDLGVGDIIINDRIVIERKCCTGTHTDFEASVINDDKRLFFQSEKLRMVDDLLPIVLLEGPVHQNSRTMLLQQVDGALSFLTTLQGLSVINTLSLRHTAYMILKLATHDRSGLGYELSLRPKKPKAVSEHLAFVLEGAPGISAKIAKEIALRFPNLASLAAASQEDLASVPGLGPKRVQSLWVLIHG
jgi:ERCC4-type nuclease